MSSENVVLDDPDDIVLFLGCNQTLVAEILSYTISSTLEFARFRRVCKTWKDVILPYCLEHRLIRFLKVCSSSPKSHPQFLPELVNIGSERFAGRLYEDLDVLTDMLGKNNFDFFLLGGEAVSVQSMLIVSDPVHSDFVVARKEPGDDFEDIRERFSSICRSLCDTDSWEEFQTLGQEALSTGMFLSIEDFESTARSDFSYETRTVPIILTLRVRTSSVPLSQIDTNTGIMRLQVRIPTSLEDSNFSTVVVPFVKYLSTHPSNKNVEDTASLSTFTAYIAGEQNGDGMLNCQIPLSLAWWELLQLFESYGLNEEHAADSFLPVDSLWRTCQESYVREGVAVVDGILSPQLCFQYLKQIDLITENPENSKVLDIVDPCLYSYMEGVSPILGSQNEEMPVQFPDTDNDAPILQTIDFWGRKYTGSCQYQWLPTFFDVLPDGSCTLCDYINNLVPRSQYDDLYTTLQDLFSRALPLLESVYGYCREVKCHHLRIVETTKHIWQPSLPPSVHVGQAVSFCGQRLQVITKMVEVTLAPGETFDDIWKVEGMPHEEIVATAMCILRRDECLEGGNLQFKRSFFQQEANYIFSNFDRTCPCEVESIIQDGLLPLGQVSLLPGRLLVVPNCHVRKMTKLENTGTRIDRRLSIVFFHLVNPEKRILSTREVPSQQGRMTKTEALKHRDELLSERSCIQQDWNVRQICLV